MVEALSQLADALTVVEGRKHVLFFSRGLPDRLLADAGFREAAQGAIARTRSSATVIHSFLPDALPVSDVHDVRQMGSGLRIDGGSDPLGAVANRSVFNNRQILNMLSEETGGTSTFYRHNLGGGLTNVERATRAYYALTFSIDSGQSEFVDIDLRSRRPGVEVLSTPSRLAVAPPEKLSADQHMLRVASALDLTSDRSDMGLEVLPMPLSVSNGIGRLALTIEIPFPVLDDLLTRGNAETLDFELLGLAVDSTRTVRDYFRSKISLGENVERLRATQAPLRYHNFLTAPAGSHYVKILVREVETGAIATRVLRFDVPQSETGSLRVAGPVVVSTDARIIHGVDRNAVPVHREGLNLDYPYVVSGMELTPVPSPRVAPGDSVDMFAVVYGLLPYAFTGQPEASFAVSLTDGRVEVQINEVRVLGLETMPLDGAQRARVRIRLPGGVDAGHWSLVLKVTDEVSGQRAEGRGDIRIVG